MKAFRKRQSEKRGREKERSTVHRFTFDIEHSDISILGSRTILQLHYIATALYFDKSDLVAISCAK